jgi:hypothetical protein
MRPSQLPTSWERQPGGLFLQYVMTGASTFKLHPSVRALVPPSTLTSSQEQDFSIGKLFRSISDWEALNGDPQSDSVSEDTSAASKLFRGQKWLPGPLTFEQCRQVFFDCALW